MTDTAKLNGAIGASGLKKSFIAKRLGLSLKGLQNKLENNSEFKASEIVLFQELLKIDDETRDQIFLGK